MGAALQQGVQPTIGRTAALLAAGALTLLPLLPAAAHDELTAVTPEPDSVLTTAPEELELTFSGEIMDIGHQILVTDSEGRSVTEGPLEPEEVQGRDGLVADLVERITERRVSALFRRNRCLSFCFY